MAAEGDVESQSQNQVGLRYRWPFPFAILHVMETGKWTGAAKTFLMPRKSTLSDMTITDPMPLIMEVLCSIGRLRRRRLKTLRSKQDWSEISAGGIHPETPEQPSSGADIQEP